VASVNSRINDAYETLCQTAALTTTTTTLLHPFNGLFPGQPG